MDASAVRIRDNQRRSRARRKEYLEDIQKKLQEYERQGVQATLDMQQAARDVAIENDRLRMLLQQRGVTSDEISAFLQSFPSSQESAKRIKIALNPLQSPQRPGHRHPKMALPPLSAAVTTPPKETNPISTPVAIDPVPPMRSCAPYCPSAIRTPPEYGPTQFPAHPYSDVVLPPIQTIKTSEEIGVDRLSVLAHASARQDCCNGQTKCVVPPEVSQAPSPAATVLGSSQPHSTSPGEQNNISPLEMSCSQAARIIADMQGHGDYNLAKEALGCNSSQECIVKNSAVFQVLENQEPI